MGKLTVDQQGRFLLGALRALIRSQQIADRANVDCCGMTLAQAATLHVLYLEGAMRLGALGKRLGIAPSTLTRNLERIERHGWVERVVDPDDGRAYRLRLSRSGRRQARAIEDQNQAAARQLLELLPAPRRQRALDGLLDLLTAIDRVAGAQSPDESKLGQFQPIRDFLDSMEARQGGHHETRSDHASRSG